MSEFWGYDRTSDFRRYLKKFLKNHKAKSTSIQKTLEEDRTISDKDSLHSSKDIAMNEEVKMSDIPQESEMPSSVGLI